MQSSQSTTWEGVRAREGSAVCCLLDSPPIITKPDADSSLWLQNSWSQFAQFYKSWYLSPFILSLYYLRAREASSIGNVFPWSSKETWRKKAEKESRERCELNAQSPHMGGPLMCRKSFTQRFLGGVHTNSPYKGRSHAGSFRPAPPQPCVPVVRLYVCQSLIHTCTHLQEAGRGEVDISSALANPPLI